MNFLKTYRKAKDVFAPPRIIKYFGRWQYDAGLPVWRRGPQIRLYRLFKYSFDYSSNTWAKAFSEKHPYITKIFKPIYQLPIWMTFCIFDFDITWKTKYDEIRYEFPPQFTIVAFGFSFTILAASPKSNEKDNYSWLNNDSYWEGMLNYLYDCDKDIYKTVKAASYYSMHDDDTKEEFKRWCIRPFFFLPKYQNEYYAATSRIKEEMFRDGETRLPE